MNSHYIFLKNDRHVFDTVPFIMTISKGHYKQYRPT